ncbi:SPOR domain-containing protein [Asticcacaulis excentricus]|uniref:Sporulation domain-containing protein n=1 Tax=Asticcacaulis excentricus (strain ATCC 15261 / DSM 4724 / KCTC 12464 / NCIMB 9791 / VKM B-1370 / CB 48) TaxID=573065 RepID=E8RPY9_ASTEC|nr:SPOR domain-containing protein [Asticcacaulis excentricus]ADU13162.1 Sporulation domain-containing protein [Asticcacaulis excentricus CB 48]
MRSHFSVSRLALLTVACVAAGLSGCEMPKGDGKDFQRMAARLAEIDIEGKGDQGASASETSSSATRDEPIQLAFETAKELTTGKDGLLAAMPKKETGSLIRVVNPLDMERPDADTPLETGVSASAATRPAQTRTPTELLMKAGPEKVTKAPVLKPAAKPADSGIEQMVRSVQVGSFSSRAVAEAAWHDLRAKHPGLDNFKPILQPVTAANGQALVRLRIGPVHSPEQAERLCNQLSIQDAWCRKAG